MRRRTARFGAVLAAGAALLMLPTAVASAHPLGNFTVNRYDGLVAGSARLTVDHVEDLAEIPAAQAKPVIDTNEDNALSPSELTAWADTRCAAAARGARLTVGGTSQRLTVGAAKASLRPGQAGLPTLRVECRLGAALPRGAATTIAYRPQDIGTGPGWREITARGDRRTLTGTDVAEQSLSHRLTAYPKDLLSSPANERSAALRTKPGGPALSASSSTDAQVGIASVLPRGADRWTQALTGLVARHDLTPGFAALALGTALLLGALHALAPGHGKTLMAAAAAAGGRGSRRDMFALGASVTVTHTLGVFGLGLLVTAGSAAAPSIIGWLGIASGLLVVFAGVALLRRAWRLRGRPHDHGHSHDRDHDRDHHHDRVLVTASAAPASHSHAAVPAVEPHHHGHDHHHQHHDHDHPAKPTLRGTILLGFAGGLVPSPSAVVVLVGAAALGEAWFGFLLVLAYGAGLALTLTAAGFAVVRLGKLAGRVKVQRGGRLLALAHRVAPVGTAAVVFALGCGLVLRGAAATLG
ncbi:MAG: nickel/cobalt transporter (NicO) family protein [Streptomyces sp.]|nr:nickel/cobalt transporter (NicO) family protein [Streptomyces sp.]